MYVLAGIAKHRYVKFDSVYAVDSIKIKFYEASLLIIKFFCEI